MGARRQRGIIPRYRPLADVDATLCLYCGEPADTRDHALPVSVARKAIGSGRTLTDEERTLLVTIPACRSCNSHLGARYHPTMLDRLADVRRRILANDQHGRAPEWSDRDLLKLGRTLRGQVCRLQRGSDRTRARLEFDSPILDPDGPCKGLTAAPRPLLEPGQLTLQTVDSARSVAALMEDLGISPKTTVAEAGSRLREAGYTARQASVAAALRLLRGETKSRAARSSEPTEEPEWSKELTARLVEQLK